MGVGSHDLGVGLHQAFHIGGGCLIDGKQNEVRLSAGLRHPVQIMQGEFGGAFLQRLAQGFNQQV